MNEPEDRPTPPESKEPPKPTEPYLPPRLRAALDKAEKAPAKRSPVGAILGIVAIVLVAAGAWWFVQMNQAKVKAAARAVELAAAARAAAVADSLASLRAADSLRVVARADSAAAFLKLPRWKQNQILGKGSPEEPNAAEEGTFVLDVGSFLFADPAIATANRLKGKTPFEVRVVSVAVGSDTTYHVYVGRFGIRGDAQDAANDLLGKGALNEAKVVTLAK